MGCGSGRPAPCTREAVVKAEHWVSIFSWQNQSDNRHNDPEVAQTKRWAGGVEGFLARWEAHRLRAWAPGPSRGSRGAGQGSTCLQCQLSSRMSLSSLYKMAHLGNFLAVKWLGLCTFTAQGLCSIPGGGTNIPSHHGSSTPPPQKAHQSLSLISFFFIALTKQYICIVVNDLSPQLEHKLQEGRDVCHLPISRTL